MTRIWDITWLDEAPSTNDEVWNRAKVCAREGMVVAARLQTHGRGQWNRAWVSPRGGLYFSTLLKPSLPKQEWPGISGILARAIAECLRNEASLAYDDIWVKEPNDILCRDGKLCGTSLESKQEDILVVGIGINVFEPEKPIITDGRNTPAYLEKLATKKLIDKNSTDAEKQAYLESLLKRI